MNRRMMMAYIMSHQSRLPAEFQEVEYIESSGTQYIDTGVQYGSTKKVIADIQYLSINDFQINGIYEGSSRRWQFGIASNNFIGGIGNYGPIMGVADTNRHTFVIDLLNKQYGYDGNITTDTRVTIGDSNKSFLLFVRYNSNNVGPANFCSQKLYSCQFYDSNVLVRDFVPCYRKSDNVIGLYDLVNGVFYTNAGTGTFIVGGNV